MNVGTEGFMPAILLVLTECDLIVFWVKLLFPEVMTVPAVISGLTIFGVGTHLFSVVEVIGLGLVDESSLFFFVMVVETLVFIVRLLELAGSGFVASYDFIYL